MKCQTMKLQSLLRCELPGVLHKMKPVRYLAGVWNKAVAVKRESYGLPNKSTSVQPDGDRMRQRTYPVANAVPNPVINRKEE